MLQGAVRKGRHLAGPAHGTVMQCQLPLHGKQGGARAVGGTADAAPTCRPCRLGQSDAGHGQSGLKVLQESEDSCAPHAGWCVGSLHADPA